MRGLGRLGEARRRRQWRRGSHARAFFWGGLALQHFPHPPAPPLGAGSEGSTAAVQWV
jgi:hypothetical protein